MMIFLTFTPDYHISPFSVTDGFLCCFYVTILKDFYHLTQFKKYPLQLFTQTTDALSHKGINLDSRYINHHKIHWNNVSRAD